MRMPTKLNIVTFVCSGCGKRSKVVIKDGKMVCTKCGEVFVKDDEGEWQAKKWLDFKENQGCKKIKNKS